MEINVRVVQGVAVVELAGDLNWQSVPKAREGILAVVQAHRALLLDLSRVVLMTSAGLRMLVIVYRAVAGQGGRALLVAIPPHVKEIMTVTGFLDLFAHRDSVEAGIAELCGQA